MEYSRRLLGETCAERLYARLADVEGRPDCADLFDGLAD